MKSLEQYYPLCAASFMSGGFGAALGAVGSLVGGLFQNKAIDKQNDMIREENHKNRVFANQEATNSYLRQLHLTKMQMNYDSAVNQRKRLEEAGLNPYLMMDGGDAGSVSSQSAPQANQPSSLPYQAQRYEWLQNMAMQSAQIANIQADTKGKLKDAGLTDEQRIGQELENARNRFELDLKQKYDEAVIKAGLNEADSRTALYDANRGFTREQELSVIMERPYKIAGMVEDNVNKVLNNKSLHLDNWQKDLLRPYLVAAQAEQVLMIRANRHLANTEATLNQQEINRNDATFNSFVAGARYDALGKKYDVKSKILQYGVDSVTKGAFMRNASSWERNFIFDLNTHLSTLSSGNQKLDNFLIYMANGIGNILPTSTAPMPLYGFDKSMQSIPQ